MSTLTSIFVTWYIADIMFLFSAGVILISSGLVKLTKVEISSLGWMMIVGVCIVQSLRAGHYLDLVVYLFLTPVFFLMINLNVNAMYHSMTIMVLAGLFFSLGEFWQLLFPSQFYAWLYPRFGPAYQRSILRQFRYHKMCTGFTSQTVVSAQFILMGLYALFCITQRKRNMSAKKSIDFVAWILIFFMAGGILLTGKRSSFLFTVMGIAFTELLTTDHGKRIKRIMQVTLFFIAGGTIAAAFLPFFSSSRNSITRILEVFSGSETDISNGRFQLYRWAYSGFRENMIFGKGWGWFKATYGIEDVHNTYLQLLAECGIIGFLLVVPVMLYWFWLCTKLMNRLLQYKTSQYYALMKFSLFTQLYILMYAMVGNPLYDYTFITWYALSIIIMYCVRKNLRHMTVPLTESANQRFPGTGTEQGTYHSYRRNGSLIMSDNNRETGRQGKRQVRINLR